MGLGEGKMEGTSQWQVKLVAAAQPLKVQAVAFLYGPFSPMCLYLSSCLQLFPTRMYCSRRFIFIPVPFT